MDFYLGTLLVFLVSWERFNTIPPRAPDIPAGVPMLVATVLSWFRLKRQSREDILPPPRANTTVFKFCLYRTAYAAAMVSAYVVLCTVSGVREDVRAWIHAVAESADAGELALHFLSAAGQFGLAVLVVAILPSIPPFQGAERSLRRTLYQNASIPARQLKERTRLAKTTYVVSPTVLAKVQRDLREDDFDVADLIYAGGATTRELWTKLAALMEQLSTWQTQDLYATAFAVLRDADDATRSIDRLQERYEALKPDARTCFRALRELPNTEETHRREERFKGDVRDLLEQLYDLLSRVSLHAHFTERERVASFADIGFPLGMPQNPPTPDLNDILTLALLVFFAFAPLTWRSDITFQVVSVWAIASIVAALMPILIARKYFTFAMAPSAGKLPLAFPLVAGLAAVAAGTLISVAHQGFAADPNSFFNPRAGWKKFWTDVYPWKSLQFVIAFWIAALTRIRAYPDAAKLDGIWRYRSFGSARDALIVAASMDAVIALVVVPAVTSIRGHSPADWLTYLVGALIGGVLGFFVPTWYRANLARMDKERQAAPMPAVEPARAA